MCGGGGGGGDGDGVKCRAVYVSLCAALCTRTWVGARARECLPSMSLCLRVCA